jgi:hypothetical protein
VVFERRPLDGAPYTYLVLDALEVTFEGGCTVNACVVHASFADGSVRSGRLACVFGT